MDWLFKWMVPPQAEVKKQQLNLSIKQQLYLRRMKKKKAVDKGMKK